MLVIKTKGTHYERGHMHGLAATKNKLHPLDIYKTIFSRKFPFATLEEVVSKYRPRLNEFIAQWPVEHKGILNELEGIADGLGLDRAIVTMASMFSDVTTALLQCSVYGNNSAIGKTDDIESELLGGNLLEHAIPETGYSFAAFTFAGTLCCMSGMNETGLSIAQTGIPGKQQGPGGIAGILFSRIALNLCADIDELKNLLETTRINNYGFSMLATDCKGNIALFEKNSQGFRKLSSPKNGFYYHTNHIIDKSLAMVSPQQPQQLLENSIMRYKTIEKLAGHQQTVFEFFNHPMINQQGNHGLYSDYRAMFDSQTKTIKYYSYEDQYASLVVTEKVDISREGKTF